MDPEYYTESGDGFPVFSDNFAPKITYEQRISSEQFKERLKKQEDRISADIAKERRKQVFYDALAAILMTLLLFAVVGFILFACTSARCDYNRLYRGQHLPKPKHHINRQSMPRGSMLVKGGGR